jgi:hypothetical protein
MRKEVIGNATLYLGDVRDVFSELPAFSVVVSDPPYGISWKRGVNGARNSKPHEGIRNDGDTECRDWVVSALGDVPGAFFGSFYAPFPANLKQVLVWHKPADSGLVGSVTGFRRDAEPIFLTGKWPNRTVERSSVLRTLAGQAGTVTQTGHPHTKPVDLMREIISMCPPGVVLDPFMGSGSTGVAALKSGRGFIGIELDEGYFETCCKRLSETHAQPDMLVELLKEAEQVALEF